MSAFEARAGRRRMSGPRSSMLRTGWPVVVGAVLGVAAGAWWSSRETPRWRAAVRVDLAPGAASVAASAAAARPGLEVESDPADGAIEVRYTAPDPATAARVAREVAEELHDASLAAELRRVGTSRGALSAELLDVDQRAASAVIELVRLRDLGTREHLTAELRVWQGLLAGIERSREAGPTARLDGAVARRAPDPGIETLRARWAALRAERAGILSGSASLPETHPDVQRLSILIATTETGLEGAVHGRVGELSARLEGLGAGGGVGPDSLVAADTLRVLETLRELAARAATIRVELARTGAPEIALPAALAERPPDRLPADPWAEILIGLGAGLVAGGAAAAARLRSEAARAPEANARSTQAAPSREPSAGPVEPPAPPATSGSSTAPEPRAVAEALEDVEVPLLAVVPEVNPTLVEPLANGDFRPGPGQVAGLTAYRQLRDRLLRSRWGLKTLVVTSAHPGEGKTTTSTNLAATYARQGLKVVLIECDLRRPSLGRYFRITKQVDLMDVLFEGRDWRLALQLTRTPGLYVLLGEKSFPRAGDSLGGPEMRRLLSEITAEYDLVILDSSPLLVAVDAAVLGPIVDGVLLVVRPTRTERVTVAEAIERLREVGATVVGTVLNDPDGAAEAWLSSADPGPTAGRRESGTPVPPSRPS